MRNIITLAVTVVMTATANAAMWRCEFSATQSCSKTGCERMVPSVYVDLDLVAGTYSRCDRNRCDHFTARPSASGPFVNFDIPVAGAMAKVTRDGSALTEIVTIGHTAYLSFGTCQAPLQGPR